MIKNTIKEIENYSEAIKQANNVYNQAVKHIKSNYKEGSEMFNGSMRTANQTLKMALMPTRDTHKETIKKTFDEAKKAIKNAVAVSPSADLETLLPLIKEGKLNDTEIQIILESHKGNYIDSKMIHATIGKPFENVESLLSNIEKVENKINGFFDTYSGEPLEKMSYDNALILNGGIIDQIDTMTEGFLNTYDYRTEAEKAIGRKLKADEVVHHIDGDHNNNDPNNLMVCTREEHARIHGLGSNK